jgi:hypothetical protein
MFPLTNFSKQSPLLRTLLVLGVFGAATFAAWQIRSQVKTTLRTTVRAQTLPATPFTIYKSLAVISDGKLSSRSTVVEARSQTGDWVSKIVTQGATPISDRRIYFSSGIEVVANDEIKAKTSKMARTPLGPLQDPAADCLRSLDGATFNGWSHAGRDSILHIPVIKLRRNDGFGWHAPTLMRAELKRETDLPSEPGKPVSKNILTAHEIVTNEPDPRLFDLTGFEEVPPSEPQIRLTRYRLPMASLSEAQIRDLAKREAAVRERMRRLDEQYFAHKAKY